MLQKMQYLSDQQGIIRRYMREKEGWDLHLENSKRFILESSKSKIKGKVLVLGSGWLLDCPIDELSRDYKEVILADINHPKQIIKKTKHLANVQFIKDDLTGGLIEFIYRNIKPGKKYLLNSFITEIKSFSYAIPDDIDFVISLNILSQLSIIISDYLKTMSLFSQNELNEISAVINQSHTISLPKNKTCLICDFEEELFDEDDKLIGVNPLIFSNLPLGNFSEKWKWKFDSSMTYRDEIKTFFNVSATDL
ncbi:MAG: hypothetical protein A2W99_09950 [Bacteroidetes bacterium GWF2_33_16]|nr:MAG: hypothetical protein A2X00_05790 [Bacteroidetes bacterium GWE2_32_14]OFY03875.1 MAG: hypothetical protein A2W99_09950 [Bacteroidetes bacterium GWF2_33_16]